MLGDELSWRHSFLGRPAGVDIKVCLLNVRRDRDRVCACLLISMWCKLLLPLLCSACSCSCHWVSTLYSCLMNKTSIKETHANDVFKSLLLLMFQFWWYCCLHVLTSIYTYVLRHTLNPLNQLTYHLATGRTWRCRQDTRIQEQQTASAA